MRDRLPTWVWVGVGLAILGHLWLVLSPPPIGAGPLSKTLGRDMASYHYAVQVASEGGNPYDVEALSAAARADHTRDRVHPFFYPPPFLIAMAWTLPLDLATAYRIQYWLDELFLIAALLALWRWWRPLGPAVPAAIPLYGCLLFPAVYSHLMGQVNGLILFLVVTGLWMAQTRRELAGGILVGCAAMFKMSPAVFVAWWLLRGQHRAVLAAVGTALMLSLATLPLLGFTEQLRFYTDILPAFGTGDYNGLMIKIGMFANHSVPNILDQLFPGDGTRLSSTARWLSIGVLTSLAATAAWAFRRKGTREQNAAQVSALFLLALLIPVYTYEHHLVFALPAMVLGAVMSWRRALPAWACAAVLGASLVLCLPHPILKPLAWVTLGGGPGWLVQEAKFASLLILGGAMFALARGPRK
jgi:alpha-1,2-mannosyltransferase